MSTPNLEHEFILLVEQKIGDGCTREQILDALKIQGVKASFDDQRLTIDENEWRKVSDSSEFVLRHLKGLVPITNAEGASAREVPQPKESIPPPLKYVSRLEDECRKVGFIIPDSTTQGRWREMIAELDPSPTDLQMQKFRNSLQSRIEADSSVILSKEELDRFLSGTTLRSILQNRSDCFQNVTKQWSSPKRPTQKSKPSPPPILERISWSRDEWGWAIMGLFVVFLLSVCAYFAVKEKTPEEKQAYFEGMASGNHKRALKAIGRGDNAEAEQLENEALRYLEQARQQRDIVEAQSKNKSPEP